jgi:RNase P subunit RPR2
MEVTMTTVVSIHNSKSGKTCAKCGEALIAPEYSEYFSEEQLVLNLWSCTNCGYKFETEAAFAPAGAESKVDNDVLEVPFPSLLVA